jgi:hypothetical protein
MNKPMNTNRGKTIANGAGQRHLMTSTLAIAAPASYANATGEKT